MLAQDHALASEEDAQDTVVLDANNIYNSSNSDTILTSPTDLLREDEEGEEGVVVGAEA